VLDRYLSLGGEGSQTYRFALIAAKMLGPGPLVAVRNIRGSRSAEKNAFALAQAGWRRGMATPGWRRYCRPPERRGLVLIDPPFELPDNRELARPWRAPCAASPRASSRLVSIKPMPGRASKARC